MNSIALTLTSSIMSSDYTPDFCSSSGEDSEIEAIQDRITSGEEKNMVEDQNEIVSEEDKEMEEDPEVAASEEDEEIEKDRKKVARKVTKEVRVSRARMLSVVFLRILLPITLLTHFLCRGRFGEIPGKPVGTTWRTRCVLSILTMSFISSVYVLAAKIAMSLVYIAIPRLEYKVVRYRALAQLSFRVNTMMTRIWATQCTHRGAYIFERNR